MPFQDHVQEPPGGEAKGRGAARSGKDFLGPSQDGRRRGSFSQPSNTAVAGKTGYLEVVAVFLTVGTQTLEQMHKQSDTHRGENKSWVYSDCFLPIWMQSEG